VKTAGVVLIANIVLNFALIWWLDFGILGLAAAIAIASWLNCLILYTILHRRGHFRIEGWLASRIARQLLAGALMVGALLLIRMVLHGWFEGNLIQRMVGVAVLVGGGMAVYFPAVWMLGGTDKDELLALFRRNKKAPSA
jgi:putative peptidoglycan lipid II flippase